MSDNKRGSDRSMTIDGVRIGDDTDAYVIAEVGHNHQGDLEIAVRLIEEAHAAGANAVKLQKRDNRALYTRAMFDQPYENENSFGKTYGKHREALEFSRGEYEELVQRANALGLAFFATAFDIPSAEFLAELDLPAYKIASGDVRNLPLLRHIASFGKPVFLSTGAAAMDDVRRAYEVLSESNGAVCLMQCTASYPAAVEELDLRVIETYRREFDAVIGYSGHDNGIAMPVVAYVLGARVIEKHFTLNRAMKGTDHAFSLEPTGLRKLVRDLRRARAGLGSSEKRIHPSERGPAIKMGKKLVAARELPVGHILTEGDIRIKSPGDGLDPSHLQDLLGRPLLAAVSEDGDLALALVGDPIRSAVASA